MPLMHPIADFYKSIDEMPKEFFEVYSSLIQKGVSHTTADLAAQEAWANNFTNPRIKEK